jgi:hypothetical protein
MGDIFRKKKCKAWCNGRQQRCQAWCVPGKDRCHYHGGRSTGPRTPEGKVRCAANLVAWQAKQRALGLKVNPGYRGSRITENMARKLYAQLSRGGTPEQVVAELRKRIKQFKKEYGEDALQSAICTESAPESDDEAK